MKKYNRKYLRESNIAFDKKETKIQIIGMDVMTFEDSYSEGEIGNGQLVLTKSNLGTVSTFKEVIEKCEKEYFAISSDITHYLAFEDGRITTDVLVNIYHDIPSKLEMKMFKAGKMNLWTAHVNIYVKMVGDTWTPSVDEMALTFGIQKY